MVRTEIDPKWNTHNVQVKQVKTGSSSNSNSRFDFTKSRKKGNFENASPTDHTFTSRISIQVQRRNFPVNPVGIKDISNDPAKNEWQMNVEVGKNPEANENFEPTEVTKTIIPVSYRAVAKGSLNHLLNSCKV